MHQAAGQVALLRRFLSEFPSGACFSITQLNWLVSKKNSKNPPCVRSNTRLWYPPMRGSRLKLDNMIWAGAFFLTVFFYLPFLFFKFKLAAPKKIFLPSHDAFSIILTVLLSHLLKLPYVICHMDDAWDSLEGVCMIERNITRWFIRPLMKGADQVFVINDYMKERYEQRYSRKIDLLYPPLDVSQYQKAARYPLRKSKNEFCILYTGSIYSAQLDTLENLSKALMLLNDKEFVCHICGDNAFFQDRVKQNGSARFFRFHHLAQEETIGAQKCADLLFLGLAFHSKIQNVINTAFPAKLVEYLNSGCPILACVPQHSFVSFYVQKYELGYVLHDASPESLAETLLKIREGKIDFSRCIQNGKKTAMDHHDHRRQSARLWQSLAK